MRENSKQRGKDPIDPHLRCASKDKLLRTFGSSSEMKTGTPEEVFYELQAHQIELEMQNEELRKAQLALEESRKKYADLYDFAPVGYFTFTPEALIKEVNLTGATLLGVARQKLITARFRSIVAAKDQDRWDQHFLSVVQQEEKQACDLTLKRQDGSTFQAGLVSIRMEVSRGVSEVHTTVIDITDRKQTEEKLKESKALIEAVVENVPLMIFLKEATDLRFVIFNRAGEELLGYDRRNLIGKNNLDLFPPEQAAHFMAQDREVLDGEVDLLDIPEEPILTAGKGRRLLHTRKVCIRGSDGATKFLLGISEDITERKRAEESLHKVLDNLRKAVGTTIQVMVSAVEARDPYTAGHQIRSADLARAIATEMGFSQDKVDGVRMAGSIHDIGKLSIPAEILAKPTKLSELEFSLIKEHAQKGYEILKNVESPWPLAEMVYQHHERMDGSGYPRNLIGEEICMEARILAVADVVESMASHRPYRAGLGIDVALDEIEKNRGIYYDSAVADACLKLFRENGYQLNTRNEV